MSHVTTATVVITDLDALAAAAAELGAELVRGQKTYTWYGRSVGDYPTPEGIAVRDLGKCDHAVKVPGVRYEVGVVANGKAFRLAYDFYGNDGHNDGQKLEQRFGPKCGKLAQGYTKHVVQRQAQRKGWRTTEKKVGNKVVLTVNTGRN